MAKRGMTVRARFLSEILKMAGKFPGAENILVTAKSDVFEILHLESMEGSKVAPHEELRHIGRHTALGSAVRAEGTNAKTFFIAPLPKPRSNSPERFSYELKRD